MWRRGEGGKERAEGAAVGLAGAGGGRGGAEPPQRASSNMALGGRQRWRPLAAAGGRGRSREALGACCRRRFPQSERSEPRQRRRNKMAAGGDPERDAGNSD